MQSDSPTIVRSDLMAKEERRLLCTLSLSRFWRIPQCLQDAKYRTRVQLEFFSVLVVYQDGTSGEQSKNFSTDLTFTHCRLRTSVTDLLSRGVACDPPT